MPSSHNLRLAPEAVDDITDILQHSLEIWGPDQQSRYAAQIHTTLHTVQQHPGIGRARDDLYPRCRGYQCVEHVVYSDFDGTTVTVARVLHRRVDAAERLRDSRPD